MLGLKRLTKNDVSWFKPNSKSHQSGINLPLKSFKEMFIDVFEDNTQEAPRVKLSINWFLPSGELLEKSISEVIMYHSKKELRLVGIPRNCLSAHIEINSHLLFNRNEVSLDITILSDDFQHMFNQLDLGSLLRKLPPTRD